MKCVILAAGKGERLQEKGPSKPLVPLRGTPLIEHVMNRAHDAGVDGFFVVSGYRGEELRAELARFEKRSDFHITHIVNDAWQRSNGVSLLCAKPWVDGEFLLTMCDHIVDPAILRALLALAPDPDTVTLAVDYEITNPRNDIIDATRVLARDDRIVTIDKLLPRFNALDTGCFRCGRVMFEALETSQAEGDDSISGAMRVLAREGRARVLDIGSRAWVDVDDGPSFAKAEDLLTRGVL